MGGTSIAESIELKINVVSSAEEEGSLAGQKSSFLVKYGEASNIEGLEFGFRGLDFHLEGLKNHWGHNRKEVACFKSISLTINFLFLFWCHIFFSLFLFFFFLRTGFLVADANQQPVQNTQ